MPRDNGHHSTGKGKGKSKGLLERLDTLSLEDTPDPYTPRSGPSSYPYDQPEYQQYQQYPVGSDEYTYQSPSAGDGFASTSTSGDGYGGYPNAYQTVTGSSSSGDASWSNTGSSMNTPISPSSTYSYGGASVSSYASSQASSYAPTVSTTASSAPSRRDPMSVDHHIAQLPPTQNRYQLPCEFLFLTGCDETFQDGDESAWMDHTEDHLRGKFPTKLKCWFCDTFIFDAGDQWSCGDKLDNFHKRMQHIRDHIVGYGCRTPDMRPDGLLIRHLRHERIISGLDYEDILNRLNPTTVPKVPSSRSGQLEIVEEEPYSTHRDKKKKDKHESSRKKGSRK